MSMASTAIPYLATRSQPGSPMIGFRFRIIKKSCPVTLGYILGIKPMDIDWHSGKPTVVKSEISAQLKDVIIIGMKIDS